MNIPTEIKYGTVIGVGVSAWVLLEFLLGFHTTRMHIGQYTGYLSIIVPILGIYFALKEIKKKEAFGFWKGVKHGMLIVSLAAVIITVFFYGYNTVIHPGWLDRGIEYQTQQMRAQGISEGNITAMTHQMRVFYTSAAQYPAIFLGILLQGLILSLIIAVFMRTPPNAIPENVVEKPKKKR
ncbi:DUF4199 domain-containing protein [Candidatus Woesearchaeota archaeon]|nr:DUF4199 domain-containing protein [Candidatus Woesearchaeota archaeon]